VLGKDEAVNVAKLVFGMNQSLDGYVDHMRFAPSPTLFRHFIKEAEGQAGSIYGRHMYEIMRNFDEDHPEWDADRHAFAAAWRNQPKWVVSRALKSVGPNAKLACRLRRSGTGDEHALKIASDHARRLATCHSQWDP
jgi:hypothetical protein